MSYCKICGKVITNKKLKKYCSYECSKKGIYNSQRKYNLKHPEKAMMGRYKLIIKNSLGNKCQKCGSTERLEIHEKTYSNTTINDCVLLCKKCHMTYHYNWDFSV